MTKKILIIDDEQHLVDIIVERVRSAGYDVAVAFDAVQAVSIARKEDPDLILLDMKMPGGGGLSVFERLKKINATAVTPVIFITALPGEEVKKQVMDMGAAGFIRKPFDGNDMIEQIKDILGEDTPASLNKGR